MVFEPGSPLLGLIGLRCVGGDHDLFGTSTNGVAMNFIAVRAIFGSRLSLDVHESHALRDNRLAVVMCERGTLLSVPLGVVAVICPILGSAGVMTGEWSTRLSRGDICVGDAQTRHDVVVSPRGACIVIAGTPTAWTAPGRKAVHSGAVLFPAFHRCVRRYSRRLLRFARDCMNDRQGAGSKQLAHQLVSLVNELQCEFDAMIARCPGSTLSRKKAVFLRLQRVRNHISACAHQDLDVANLALMANYSVGHFITTFRSVFDETPYSNVSRYRLESASTLLSESKLGIGDIAQAIGYQSRSSFTRAIRKHLGSSATQFRASTGMFAGEPADEVA